MESGTPGNGTETFMQPLGRVLGDWPTLAPAARFEGRDLAVTTDFRDLFSEVLVRHLGATNLGAVFSGFQSDASRWTGVMGSPARS